MLLSFALLLAARQTARYPAAFETPVEGGEAMQVMVADRLGHATKLADGQYPSTSADGKWVAFAKTLWMADENVTAGLSSKLEVQDLSGAPPKVLATFNGPVTVSMPMFSPNGKEICFEVVPQRPDKVDVQRGVYVIPSKGGKARLLYKPTSMPAAMTWPAWTSKGKEILLVEGNDLIWIDPNSKKLRKRPASSLIGDWAKDSRIAIARACPTDDNLFAFTLAHQPGQAASDRQENVYVDRLGVPIKTISGGGTGWHPRWSPDGMGVYFYEVLPGGQVADFRYWDRKTQKASTVFGE